MKEVTLSEMRQLQLRILDCIHEYCMANNIRYSLGGGTLLGAIRHKGFIPWDDDVDVMMPRKLKAIAAYDDYLAKHYGDYMKLPPKEEHISRHTYKCWWK